MGWESGIQAGSEPEPQLGAVGIFWACWACIWTALLLAGMTFLVYRRRVPILRIRGIALSLSAIALLHLYWISVQLGYILGPLAPGDAEYWIMGTYLPFGIALFHASNSRFLHIAKAQKKYVQQGSRVIDAPASSRRSEGIVGRFRRLDYTTKIITVVGFGMLFQLFLTVFMYLISRKWHSSWGIPGTELTGNAIEQKIQMRRGWEWWPSVFWQFFWAWIIAPFILWQARGIHDTQGWRAQTIGCAISSLHATPMWLIALYVPAMGPVNKYWIPPQWIAISIMMIEIFTVFLPCWEVRRHRALRQETLDSIAQWESNKVSRCGAKSVSSASTMVESVKTGWKSTNGSVRSSTSGESILTMSALEHVLERNPVPLQEFAALRDFSGENIAFLTCVAEWKGSLPAALRDGKGNKDAEMRELVRERFNCALRIYADFISTRDADFPINISSPDLKRLEGVFEESARVLYGEKRDIDPATPFDIPRLSTKPHASSTSPWNSSRQGNVIESSTTKGMCDRLQSLDDIPEGFDTTVFDDAEKSIKYLVLTNTWPKFVRDRRSSMDSFEDLEAGNDIKQYRRQGRGKRAAGV